MDAVTIRIPICPETGELEWDWVVTGPDGQFVYLLDDGDYKSFSYKDFEKFADLSVCKLCDLAHEQALEEFHRGLIAREHKEVW